MANQPLMDGTQDFSAGQDAWHSPDRIGENQYAKGVNVSTRRGTLSPRYGVNQLGVWFENKTLTTSYGYQRTIEDIWTGGKFQAFIPFPVFPDDFFITVISGLIFRTRVRDGFTTLVSSEIRVNQYYTRINWCYAAGKIVLYDYPDYPVVVGPDDIFRCSKDHEVDGIPAPQIPISANGTYNQNRLFIANDGVEFTASDAVGNLATPEAPFTFTEVLTPNTGFTGQVFSLSVEEAIYPIQAMGFIQQLDIATGIGPMFIATEKKFYFYHTEQPRVNWGQGQFGGVLLANAGIAGPRAFVNVNSDLIFMAGGGTGYIHALSTSRNDVQTWGDVPISREVENYLKLRDPSLQRVATMGYFNNHIFISANPYRLQATDRSQRPVSDFAHGGMVVLEIDQLSSFLKQGSPVWAGLWTGMDVMDYASIGNKMYAIVKDGCTGAGVNAIYEIDKDATVDFVIRGKRKEKRPIRSVVYTKEYDFKNPFLQKRDSSLNFLISDIRGDFSLNVEKKPSHANRFLEWGQKQVKAPSRICDGFPSDELINGIAPCNLKQVIFGDPIEEGCNPVTSDDYSTYLRQQFRLTLEGDYWVLNSLKINSEPVPFVEREDESCEPLFAPPAPAACDPDWLVPEVNQCP